MGNVKMLNLYRGRYENWKNPEESELLEQQKELQQYSVADYFDKIVVEDIKEQESTLARCMGILRLANKTKKGISHQRYCIIDEGEENDREDDIFLHMDDYPVFTLIQVFINPCIYQAQAFNDADQYPSQKEREISCKNCIRRIEDCISREWGQSQHVRWKIYRLLTAGDFAVVVRSKTIHEAYDIGTFIRSIRISDGAGNDSVAFYSYSISGVPDRSAREEEAFSTIDWVRCLDAKDRVALRIELSPTFRMEISTDDEDEVCRALESGYRLLGRYDVQFLCTPEEYQQLYKYIGQLKCGQAVSVETRLKDASKDVSKKVQTFLWMLEKGYVSYVNEKFLLQYEMDDKLFGNDGRIWKLVCNHKWKNLYEENKIKIEKNRKKMEELDRTLEQYYASARNLKDYMRIAGRLYRILYEMNQHRELRISTANLLAQMEVMRESVSSYLEWNEACNNNPKDTADLLEEYFRLGTIAAEMFTRYVRNINQQTMQTTNYDLQTNVFIEKLLLAYSQFLRPFVSRRLNYEQGYHLRGPLYPIVVPSMGVQELSVCVLFDNRARRYDSDGDVREDQKLMAVYTPTFAALCETCFLIPTVFHEIAHQMRYEDRKTRNACLQRYILKGIILDLLLCVIDPEQEYRFMDEKITEDLVEEIYRSLDEKICEFPEHANMLQGGLYAFERDLIYELEKFAEEVCGEEHTVDAVVRSYVTKTREYVRSFNERLLKLLAELNNSVKKLEDAGKGDIESKLEEVKRNLGEYKEAQTAQILKDIEEILEDQCREESDQELKKLTKRFQNCFANQKSTGAESNKAGLLSDLQEWTARSCKNSEKKNDLGNLLKYYIRLEALYKACESRLNVMDGGRKDLRLFCKTKYQKLFDELCESSYQKILNALYDLQKTMDSKLPWESIPITEHDIEYLKKRIAIGKADGIKKQIKPFLKIYRDGLSEIVTTKIELYGEVTSDLFMCAIMGFDAIGYLVYVAENFRFRKGTADALYLRTFLVLQCIAADKNKREQKKQGAELSSGQTLRKEEFADLLESKLRSNFEILKPKIDKLLEETYKCETDVTHWTLDDMQAYADWLRDLEAGKDIAAGKVEIGSSDRWIIRMYVQIVPIVQYLCEVELSGDEIITKELWKDISNENSYLGRQDKLREMLDENGGKELCDDIRDILNCPADYFRNRKSLMMHEVQFVLKHYEENCRQIFKTLNMKEEKDGDSPV